MADFYYPERVTETRTYKDFLAATDTALAYVDDRLRLFVEAYRERKVAHPDQPLRVLDIACGKKAVLHRFVSPGDEYFACDYHGTLDVEIPRYFTVDLNDARLSDQLPAQKFDVVFCGEILEHLYSPDALLDEIRLLMGDDGVLVLSTPNLAYYVNRILLLAGLSPLYLENSADVKLGRRFRFLGQGNTTEGHIRLFTYRALRDLLDRKGFDVVRVTPTTVWNFWPDRLVCRISRSLAPNNVFVVRLGS
jgi:SAM-dependent methyltransferase